MYEILPYEILPYEILSYETLLGCKSQNQQTATLIKTHFNTHVDYLHNQVWQLSDDRTLLFDEHAAHGRHRRIFNVALLLMVLFGRKRETLAKVALPLVNRSGR